MAWIRISDDFPEHEKFEDVGTIATGLWVTTLAYCNRNGTNGLIHRRRARRLGDFPDDLPDFDFAGYAIARLLKSGLWHEQGHDCADCVQPGDDRYVVHDYLEWQLSLEEMQDKAAKNRDRVAAWRAKKAAEKQAAQEPLASSDVARPAESNAYTDVTALQARTYGAVTDNPNPNPNPNSSSFLTSFGKEEPGAAAAVGNVTPERALEIAKPAAAPPGNGDPNNPRCTRHSTIPPDDPGPSCRNCRRHREWLETTSPTSVGTSKLAATRKRNAQAVAEAKARFEETA